MRGGGGAAARLVWIARGVENETLKGRALGGGAEKGSMKKHSI